MQPHMQHPWSKLQLLRLTSPAQRQQDQQWTLQLTWTAPLLLQPPLQARPQNLQLHSTLPRAVLLRLQEARRWLLLLQHPSSPVTQSTQ